MTQKRKLSKMATEPVKFANLKFIILILITMTSQNYKGVIIEESIKSNSIIKKLKILNTEIEKVTKRHKTPWIKQWTLYTVEIPENQANNIAKELSEILDSEHNWYADFKNNNFHYIIFHNKVFKVDRLKKEQYDEVTKYGVSLGIPGYQLDFSSYIK